MTPKMLGWSIQADSTRKTVLRMSVDGLAKESNQLLQADADSKLPFETSGTMLIPPEISCDFLESYPLVN